MTTLVFGNTAPTNDGAGETIVEFPEGLTLVQQLFTLTAQDGVVANHTSAAPSWVASDDDSLASIVAEHYGCPKVAFPPAPTDPTIPGV